MTDYKQITDIEQLQVGDAVLIILPTPWAAIPLFTAAGIVSSKADFNPKNEDDPTMQQLTDVFPAITVDCNDSTVNQHLAGWPDNVFADYPAEMIPPIDESKKIEMIYHHGKFQAPYCLRGVMDDPLLDIGFAPIWKIPNIKELLPDHFELMSDMEADDID
jgi:hypothetical protein